MCSLRFPIDFPMGNPIIPYCWGEWMSINPSYFHVHQALDLQLYPVKQEFLRAHPIFFYFSWWISIPPHIFATPLPLTCSGACPDASALRGPGRRGGPPLALPMVADPISRSGPGGWDAYHRPYMIFSAHIVHTQIYIYIYHIILYILYIYCDSTSLHCPAPSWTWNETTSQKGFNKASFPTAPVGSGGPIWDCRWEGISSECRAIKPSVDALSFRKAWPGAIFA